MNPSKDKSADSQRNRKDRGILALLQRGGTEKAAEAVGIYPPNLCRWRKQPDFQQALREVRHEAFSRSIARLQHTASATVAMLVGLMIDPQVPASRRVQAAQCVVDPTQKGLEREDLKVRVDQMKTSARKDDPHHVRERGFPSMQFSRFALATWRRQCR